MAGLWYRTGTVSVTNGSNKITGFGTTWKTGANRPDKGHTFWGPDGKHYEVDSIESDTVLYLVKAYTGVTAAGQPYEIDITRTSTIPAVSREVAALLAYAQSQYEAWQAILTGVGDVTLTAPDGQTVTVPALASMLSKSGNLAGLASNDAALGNLGLSNVGKAVAKSADQAAARTAIAALRSEAGSYDGDIDALVGQGVFQVSGGNDNWPWKGQHIGHVMNFTHSAGYAMQLAINADTGAIKQRNASPSGWTAFVDILSSKLTPMEFGTFTPIAYGIDIAGAPSYSNATGLYYRKGKEVKFELTISFSSLGGAAGVFLIGGLPFVCRPETAVAASVCAYSGLSDQVSVIGAVVRAGASDVYLNRKAGGSNDALGVICSDFTSGGGILVVSGSYIII